MNHQHLLGGCVGRSIKNIVSTRTHTVTDALHPQPPSPASLPDYLFKKCDTSLLAGTSLHGWGAGLQIQWGSTAQWFDSIFSAPFLLCNYRHSLVFYSSHQRMLGFDENLTLSTIAIVKITKIYQTQPPTSLMVCLYAYAVCTYIYIRVCVIKNGVQCWQAPCCQSWLDVRMHAL